MSDKLLVLHAEGIGNFIQIFPLLRTLKEVLGFEIHYCHLFGSYNVDPKNVCPYIDIQLSQCDLQYINSSDYVGKVTTFWGRNHLKAGNISDIKLLCNIHPIVMDESEVFTYLKIALDLGISEDKLIWEARCNYNEGQETFDVIIANGYNKNGNWEIKGYPYYEKVSSELVSKGLKIACIGSGDEYIDGTIDMTGLSLLDSLGVIKNSKALLGNDSGLYHAANALGVDNLVIFTATSIKKNYDERFHTYTNIICREDLECRPCQHRGGWKSCNDWKCREINPKIIIEEILNKL